MVLTGIIEEIVYRNDDNSYTVAILDVHGEPITAVGKFPVEVVETMSKIALEAEKSINYQSRFEKSNFKANVAIAGAVLAK